MARCSFCKRSSRMVEEAIICDRCAKGRTRDKWCDFCKQSADTKVAYICPNCAKGLVGDRKCDFCNSQSRAHPAMICKDCTKR